MRSSDAGTPTDPPWRAWNSGRKYIRESLFVTLAGVSVDPRPEDLAGPLAAKRALRCFLREGRSRQGTLQVIAVEADLGGSIQWPTRRLTLVTTLSASMERSGLPRWVPAG